MTTYSIQWGGVLISSVLRVMDDPLSLQDVVDCKTRRGADLPGIGGQGGMVCERVAEDAEERLGNVPVGEGCRDVVAGAIAHALGDLRHLFKVLRVGQTLLSKSPDCIFEKLRKPAIESRIFLHSVVNRTLRAEGDGMPS